MKKFLCIAFVLISFSVCYSQDALSLYNLGDVPQVYHFNPAEYDSYPSSLVLPATGIYANYNNPLSFTDVFDEAKSAYKFDDESILNRLKDKNVLNRLNLEAKVELFYYGIKLPKNTTLRFFANLKSYTLFNYPTNLLDAYFKGWGGDNLGKLFPNTLAIRYASFAEAGVGITKGFGRALQLGGSIKYYYGLSYMDTGNSEVSIISHKTDYSLDILTKDFEVNYTEGLFSGGNGVGIDLGATYDFGLVSEATPIRIGVSLLDLGVIQWDVTRATASDGSTMISSASDINDISSVHKLFTGYKVNQEKVISMVPYKVFGSLTYYPTGKDTFVFSNLNTFYTNYTIKGISNIVNSTLSLGYSRKLWRRKISLSVSGVKLPEKPIGLGSSMSARFGMFQFYLASDDVLGMADGLSNVSDNLRILNIRAGFNFIFGMPKVTGGRKRSFGSKRKSGGGYKERGAIDTPGYNSGRGARSSTNNNNKGRGNGIRSNQRGGAVDTHGYICTYCRATFSTY